jgi:DNA-binding response OmpR family regulator
MRLLIVEDDEKIASFLKKGLKESGFAVDVVNDGESGLIICENAAFDAAVIDIMLPGIDGLELIEKLRAKKINIPVLILSAKRSVNDRIKGLQRGGDDYLVKPFVFSELLVRLQALIRRSSGMTDASELRVDDLVMNVFKREVYRGDKKIELQPKEFSLLEYFMRNPGHSLSKTLILEKIWDYNFDPQTNVVDVLVCRLRNKIDKDFNRKIIKTVRGVGYILEKD